MSLIPTDLTQRVQQACAGAVELWGQEPQFRQAQEEFGEATAAINRMLRGRAEGWTQTVEETADVILCAFQLRIMLGPEVDVMIEKKLARLEERIEAAR